MSGNTYSLPHSTGHTNSISLETLDFLTSKLLKRFETFISKLHSNQSEAKDVKNLCFSLISSWYKAYTQEVSNNKANSDYFIQIQKEAGFE